LVDYGESDHDSRWIAVGLSRRGDCEVARGNLGEASMNYHEACAHFGSTGRQPERVSAEWGVARILLQAGQT